MRCSKLAQFLSLSLILAVVACGKAPPTDQAGGAAKAEAAAPVGAQPTTRSEAKASAPPPVPAAAPVAAESKEHDLDKAAASNGGGAAAQPSAPASGADADREGGPADDNWSPQAAFAQAGPSSDPAKVPRKSSDAQPNRESASGPPPIAARPKDDAAAPERAAKADKAKSADELAEPLARQQPKAQAEKKAAVPDVGDAPRTAEGEETPLHMRGIGTGGGGKTGTRAGVGAPRGGSIGVIGTLMPNHSSDRVFRWLPAKPAYYPKDARYRSNYLPGRGYLQHLAAQVRGGKGLGVEGMLVPPSPLRSLQAPPSGQALRVAVDLSEQQVSMAGGHTTVRVRLRASENGPQQRPPLRLHLVLDNSGSMKGKPWQQVCAAVRDLATRLGPDDQLSVSYYGTTAQILAAPTAGGPALQAIADQVCKLKPHGETNTHGGLALGYQQARSVYLATAANRVLLLSDGMPTVGPNDPYYLTLETTRALGDGIVTSAIGLGNDFDALLMDRIALEGGGNHHFVRDAAALPTVLSDELEVLTRQAAEAVDVRIRLPQDVGLVEVVGSEPLSQAEALRVRQVEVAADQRLARDQHIAANRQRDYDGGVRFLLPSFRAGDEHAFLIVLDIPPGSGHREVARVEVRYKDTVSKKNGQFVGGRGISYVPIQDAQPQVSGEVKLAEARARAGAALQRASEYLEVSNLPAIRQELYAAALALQRAADATGSAQGHAEATRVQALADAAGQGINRGQLPWLTTVFHYNWRMCGGTAWEG